MYAGIGQGSALGPLLFSMYVNDISSCINVPFILYADDVILYADGTDCNMILSQLENYFANLCLWCEQNEMRANFDKTKFMIFHKEKASTVGNVSECVILGRTMGRVFEFKYLGLLLDPHLNFNKHSLLFLRFPAE
jgi:ribonuclease P/MRP protein subunit RPP40